jgi:hypothetical protein
MMLEEINQLRLSKSDTANILDALNEWFKSTPKNNVISSGIWSRSLKKDETIGAKELNDDEVGLDYQRWVELKLRLTDFLENKNEFDPPP